MKALAVILAVALVTACTGMRSSGSSSGTSSGTSGPSGNSSDYRYWQEKNSQPGINRHDDPRDLYFGV